VSDDRQRSPGGPEPRDDTPISWRVARPGTPVFGSDGTLVGTLHEVAADDNEDIFHGLVVDRGGADPLVLVPRDDVSAIEDSRIDVSLDHDAAAGLEPYSTAGASDSPLGGLDT
jgi:sporulation protein YlmC with PRC-barrel domain